MKKACFSCLFLLVLLTFPSFSIDPVGTENKGICAACNSTVESLEYPGLPYFEQGDWYESWDPWYGTHGTSLIEFSDGYKGKIFIGGISKKYFIGDTNGGKYYYISQETTVRALYLYKKYNCISKRYRN